MKINLSNKQILFLGIFLLFTCFGFQVSYARMDNLSHLTNHCCKWAPLNPSDIRSPLVDHRQFATYEAAEYIWEDQELIIIFEEGHLKKWQIAFGMGGVNQLFGFASLMAYNKAGNMAPKLEVSTDFLGPYIVKSMAHDDLESPQFTGGYHGTNGDSTGRPTANLESLTVKVDETILKGVQSGSFQHIEIETRNEIVGYNCLNTPILEETITYNIYPSGRVVVTNQIKALSELQILRYYGFQSQNKSIFQSVLYLRDDHQSVAIRKQLNYSESPDCHTIVQIGCDRNMQMSLYNEGLGTFSFNATNATTFTTAFTKTYFNLVNGKILNLKNGEQVYWKGEYVFK